MPNKTMEELEEFMKKADKAHELVSLLKSDDMNVVKDTQDKIDNILANDWEEEDEEYKTRDGFSKSCISKIKDEPTPTDSGGVIGGFPDMPSDQAGFMRAFEEDANRRAENRKRKEEKSKIRREKGNEHFKHGRYEEAISEYDIAIKLTGWEVTLYTNKAQCYIKMKDYDKAIEACDRALYIEEDFVKGYIQKSNALLSKKSHKEAVECLQLCLKNCKNNTPLVNNYLKKAQMLLDIDTANEKVVNSVTPENKKEFQHFLSKLSSKKVFEATIASELLLKSLQQSSINIELFRALGGIEAIQNQLIRHTEHTLHVNLFNILKCILCADKLTFYHWIYTDPTTSLVTHAKNEKYRMLVLLLLQKLIFWDSDEIVDGFLEFWSDDLMRQVFAACFSEKETKAMSVLILGRAIRNTTFLARFKNEVIEMLKCVSNYIPRLVEDDIAEQKTWIGGLSGLSMTPIARKLLDKSFWTIFLPLLDFLHKQGKEAMIDDLLAAGMNFTLDSTNLVDHGLGISEKLVGLCGNPTFQKAPLLLNRVLEKCPNTFLAEDKGQFASLLKVIRSQSDLQSDSLSTAVKLLARTTAKSVQARKWVVKYKILDKLLDLLECNTVSKDSSKTATAILSNAALSCAHCFQDESVCKTQDTNVVDTMLKHAKADKGLAIQQNAAIALARLATNSAPMLERLRDLRGLEILHSRFSLPEGSS